MFIVLCCSQPGNLPRFRSDDVDACRKDCFELFCAAETASQHPRSVSDSLADTCRGTVADKARLQQRHTGRTACLQLDRLQSVLNAAARFSDVGSSITCHRCSRNCIRSSCLPMSAQHGVGAVLPHRQALTLVTGSVYACRHRPCSMFFALNT